MSDNAIERFEALLASGKDSALLRFGLGSHYLKAGEVSRAISHLESAIAQDPGYSAAWKLLGKALVEAGDTERAADAYRSGIDSARGKGDKQAIREMEVFLRRLGRTA